MLISISINLETASFKKVQDKQMSLIIWTVIENSILITKTIIRMKSKKIFTLNLQEAIINEFKYYIINYI
jgi:hypothetical protein